MKTAYTNLMKACRNLHETHRKPVENDVEPHLGSYPASSEFACFRRVVGFGGAVFRSIRLSLFTALIVLIGPTTLSS